MNHITSSLKNLAGLLAAAVLIASTASLSSVSLRADSPATAAASALSATEAIFYTQGILDAQEFAAQHTAQYSSEYPENIIGFRTMARNNQLLADLVAKSGYVVQTAYFQGRADAFNALADLFGEP